MRTSPWLLAAMLLNSVYGFEFKNIFSSSGSTPDAARPFGHKRPADQYMSELVCQDGFLCENTKTCAKDPLHCPCPQLTDIKCPLGSDWYTCVRGDHDCDRLTRATAAI
ncbi:hypothetical protein DM01DRAFT_1379260 [Hesseltinella vesiculosa]|uniref:Long chronological lifespan protein 2 n=1 Tax=Hesseltinella vesiculosa TaxID=101127 RepID=A0A1X2GY81_9FUNG|nr:hypothetical protein DM01DRAFT_1379260 [Hesseltinella vesiculosa]